MSKKKEKQVTEEEIPVEETPQEPDLEVEEPAEQEPAPEEASDALSKAQESIAKLSERLMRTAADFDNFKKRTGREKDEIYSNAVCDTVEKILPVLDNLARAIAAGEQASDKDSVLEGVRMIQKQFEDSLSSIGVSAMETVGEAFNPEYHDAVMTEESDQAENTILEEFQKGYLYHDKVVRHAMVKVSN